MSRSCIGSSAAAHASSRSRSAFETFSRSDNVLTRSGDGGMIADMRRSGSGSHPRSRSAATSPCTASMPHFSLSGSAALKTPAVRIQSKARDGSGAESSFLSSAQTRSADNFRTQSLSRAQAFNPSASGLPLPYQAKKRKKRRMRRWSSRMRDSASPIKRSVREARSASPPTRSITLPLWSA